MATTFENYVLNVLQKGEGAIGEGVRVLDGNTDGKTLFSERKLPPAKPDYIVQKNGINKILIDAKYKPRLKESDNYQIIAHSLSYGVKVAILLSPFSDTKNLGLGFIGTVGDQYQLKVYEYVFNLGAEDMASEEIGFINCIANLLSTI